ncbi:hypothetical protein [Nioella sp.]|uniref:hypothetical protein n=1 Tax=Nioella sp. TaxID=1912091 RepID=UPI003513D54E
MKVSAQLLIFALLAGCSAQTQQGIKHAMTVYQDVDYKDYAILGETWRVFDNKDLKKMMIIAPFDRIHAAGFRDGVTFGLAKKDLIEEHEFRPAATAYLANIGCRPTDGRLVMRTQYEFDYTC